MAGETVTQAPIAGLYMNSGVGSSGEGGAPGTGVSASQLNDFRISAVINRLTIRLGSHNKMDPAEFFNLCLSLSRGIDFAVSNNEVPSRIQELPSLIKQVCQNKNDSLLQASVMVLMISIKSGCQNGWFSDGDSEELSNLAKEIASDFCSVSDFNTEPSCSLLVVSRIMSRFFPRLKLGHILVFLEAKPGYEAYVSDFQISKNLKSSPVDKIRLFVAQTDSIDTSSCLVTPSKVNFLLNGSGVERRTNVFLDAGPQIPTVVTPLLKYGSNLLQAVGDFNGNYIIAVAFMSEAPNPDSNALQDYEQHAPATVDEDSDVIEGPSRISLNCPISFRRIRTPVRGHSCKHMQCFDFDNYVDINSRRPYWRCPHCNQHICFSDIRIDQRMVQVLKEVRPNVSDIMISSDGSWNAVMENEDTVEKPGDNTLNVDQGESLLAADVLDLTQNGDAMDAFPTHETQDSKHSSSAHEIQFTTRTAPSNPQMADPNSVNQSSGHICSDFWSDLYMSTFGLGSPNIRPSEQTAGASLSSSVLTESLASPNREVEAQHHNTVHTPSAPQSGIPFPDTLQLQQHQFGNSFMTNDYGRFSWIPRHISRTFTAVQALPAQFPSPDLQRSSSNSQNSSQAPSAALNLTMNRPNSHEVSLGASSSSPLPQSIQQNSPLPSARLPHQNAGFLDANQFPNMYRVSNLHGSSTQQMGNNFRVPQATIQSPAIQPSMQSSGSFSSPVGVSSSRRSQMIVDTNRAVQMSLGSSRTAPSYLRNSTMPTPPGHQRGFPGATSEPVNYDPADLSWRSAGRMRGALSGPAYTEALNQYIIRPSQQAQAARTISNMTSPPTNVGPELQAVMANGVIQGNLASPLPVDPPVTLDMPRNVSSGLQ